MPRQRRRARGGGGVLLAKRREGGGRMAGRTGANVADENLLSAGGSTGVYTKAERKAETVGHTDHPGSRDPDGGGSDSGTDLRSRSATRATCLSSATQRVGRGAGSASRAQSGTARSRRRRFKRLLRHDSASGVGQVSGPPHQRWRDAGPAQTVVADAGGGKRWARRQTPEQSGASSSTRHSARGAHLAVAFKSLHAPVCAGMENPRPRRTAASAHRQLCR